MIPEGRFWEKSYPPGFKADFTPEKYTIPELFLSLVEEHGDRIAIDYNDHEITYTDLGRQAAQVSNALKENGIGTEDTVALYLPNTPYHPIYFFGALLTGAKVTHLSPLDAERELIFKLNDSGATTLVTLSCAPFSNRAGALQKHTHTNKIILCDDSKFSGSPTSGTLPKHALQHDDFTKDQPENIPLIQKDDTKIALLQYSGGTTGRPKAAALTHANIIAAVEIYHYWFDAFPENSKDAVLLCNTPLFHIMALTITLLNGLKMGSRIVLRQRFDIEQVLNDIEQKRVTSFSSVPTTWIAMLNYPGIEKRDLSSLNSIGSGGAPLPPEVFHNVKHLTGLCLGGGWGMTETAPAGSSLPPSPPEHKSHSIGLPLPGIDIEIVSVDNPTEKLPFGEAGEIRIKGPNTISYYWNNKSETEKSFIDGWFLTGDIASMDEEGYLYLIDRKKDLIISSGFNVYPQPIEDAIYEHPDVAEVLVIGVPDSYRGEAAKAYIILQDNAKEFSINHLRDFLSDKIGKHELPQHLEFRENLPMTAVGKYSRKLLREQEL